MSNGSFVLLQASVNEDLGDSVIELSPRQLEALGNPVIVRLQKMTETAPVKGKSRKTVHPGSKLLVETIENPLLDDDSCRLSATSISIITGATPIGSVGGAAACLRLSLVQRLAPHAFEKKTESEEQRLQQWQRAQLVVDMQTAMAKLTYDKEWYQSQAERFRSELSDTVENLEQVEEERRLAVIMCLELQEQLKETKATPMSAPSTSE